MIHYFGIRHHGPGCARSLLGVLEQIGPDCVLIEGPPEGEGVLEWALNAAMEPPVALLLHCPDEPALASFYPFANFSPEWHAIRHGLGRGVPVRFIDMPQAHDLALRKEEAAALALPKTATPDAAEPEAIAPEATASSDAETSDGEDVDMAQDPVDLLFGTQLGGGTDINRAVGYCQSIVTRPQETILILISDLYEGGVEKNLLQRANELVQGGVQFITLLALSDEGAPAFDAGLAARLSALGVPSFACTPDRFPALMAAAIRKEDVALWAAREGLFATRGR